MIAQINNLVLTLIFLTIFSPAVVFAKDLGVRGKVYPILEPDALEELEERASQVDWGKLFNKEANERKVKNYKPRDFVSLPRSGKYQVRTVDISYALEFDIPDGKGGILYPKGFVFNPLDYIVYPRTIVVLNGADRDQVDWFKQSEHYKNISVVLWITDGGYYDLSSELGRPVYYANKMITARFDVKVVPCIIAQKGNLLEVTEIHVEANSK